ncbi:DUF3562 domain-containing protein [Burkholderia sp. TSV86]|uniref:DUF3562 domain-containing protein n=1 Tax=Burkholderia sp. TSV86 TaxID=1385594 RepID=UPI00075C2467|nr:DUF3562 domain-containing protein [Burkholderia sp. TSV86]KVE33994.1 hypothetical protein WS68_01385 [Burkholderia sp. TSV86]
MAQNRVDEIVQAIACETHTPAEAVLRLYEETLAEYSEGALIRDYLTVLVAKRVRQTLRLRDQAH